MTTTRGRRPYDLSRATLESLRTHGFTLLREGSITNGPAYYGHALNDTIRVSVSMSPRTGQFVQWQFQHVPEHLQNVIPPRLQSDDIDAFEAALALAEQMIRVLFDLGGKPMARVEGDA